MRKLLIVLLAIPFCAQAQEAPVATQPTPTVSAEAPVPLSGLFAKARAVAEGSGCDKGVVGGVFLDFACPSKEAAKALVERFLKANIPPRHVSGPGMIDGKWAASVDVRKEK